MKNSDTAVDEKGNPTRDRLFPYKVLAYALYAEDRPWLENIGDGRVRIITGDAARFFRIKNYLLWEAFYWLEKFKLVTKVEKEQKRGTVVLHLREVKRDRPEE